MSTGSRDRDGSGTLAKKGREHRQKRSKWTVARRQLDQHAPKVFLLDKSVQSVIHLDLRLLLSIHDIIMVWISSKTFDSPQKHGNDIEDYTNREEHRGRDVAAPTEDAQQDAAHDYARERSDPLSCWARSRQDGRGRATRERVKYGADQRGKHELKSRGKPPGDKTDLSSISYQLCRTNNGGIRSYTLPLSEGGKFPVSSRIPTR